MSTADEVAVLETELRRLSTTHPAEAMFAIMEALIDVVTGENPALRDVKRKWLYVGILKKLAAKGIK